MSPEIYDGDAVAAELDMLVVIVLDGGNGVQILADKVAQYAVTSAVKDAHSAHAYKGGIINKVHYGLDCFITTHATHIDIGLEGQFSVVYVIMRLLAHIRGSADFLDFYGLGRFQTVGLDGCSNLAECDCYVILVDRYNLTYLCLTCQTDGVTDFKSALSGRYRYVERL